MNADDLRASILQAAIRGKLTKQDPDDEPASVLVQRIREEKRLLVKEGKIKRDKNESFIFKRDGSWFETINGKDERCIDDEIPFEIPESWIWIRGYSLFNKMKSTRPTGNQFRYIDLDSIDNVNQKIKTPKIIKTANAPSRATRFILPGNVLFSMVRPYLRNIALMMNEHEGCIASTGFYVCDFNQSIARPDYIYNLMRSPYIVDGLNQFMKGDNSPSICNKDIESFLYPIPPMEEQYRIIQKINDIFSLIPDYDSYYSKKNQIETDFAHKLTNSILNSAIQGKLTNQDPGDEPASVLVERIREEKHRLIKEGKIKRDKNESFIFKRDGNWFETINGKDERCIDDEIPLDIPKNWTFVRLSTITLYDVGGATPSISESKYWNGNIKWASVRDIQSVYLNDTERRITETGFESCSTNIVPKGELIICTRVGLGKICIAGDDIAINQDLRGFIISNRIDRQYLIYYYRNIKLEGSGTTVKGITRNQILNLLIPLPPYDEQHQIVSKLNRLNSVLSSI